MRRPSLLEIHQGNKHRSRKSEKLTTEATEYKMDIYTQILFLYLRRTEEIRYYVYVYLLS